MSTTEQIVVRVHTPSPDRSSSEWRGLFVGAAAFDSAPWNDIAVAQSGVTLSLIARSPQATAWLDDRYGDLIGFALDSIGAVARVEKITRQIEARDNTPYLWSYSVPKLVVAKDNRNWERLKASRLPADTKASLAARMSRDLSDQAVAWGLALPFEPGALPLRVAIVDEGRAMPLTSAIRGSANSSGRALAVLARLDVRLVSESRLEGEWQVGMLAGLGFGRMFRTGYATTEEISQSNLDELGVQLTDGACP